MRYPVSLDAFDELVFCDSEYYAPAGHKPRGICVVAYQQRANRVTRWWLWRRRPPPPPALFTAPRTLFLSYQIPAELVLFQVLGWALPETVVDLNMEVRNLTNGQTPKPFIGLHAAALRYRIPYLDAAYKELMREIAMSGGPDIDRHRQDLLTYCEQDTLVLVPLLQRLLPQLSLPHALLRGEYMRDRARIEARGIPINVEAYRFLLTHRVAVREKIAQQANRELGCDVFDGDSLRDAPFTRFIRGLGLGAVWPRTATGRFRKDVDDTLTHFRHAHPSIEIVRGAKKSLDDLKRVALAIGPDHRNRTGGGAFGTVTGRYNPPRNREAILLRSKWWRNLIRPEPGQAIAYLDFSAEEFLVLAVLADDPQGLADYYAGDVYTTFGRATGLIPPGPQRKVPGAVRDLLKIVVLAIPYGGRARMLAQVAGISVEQAGRLIQAYHERYPRMARYVEDTARRALRTRRLRTRLDWRLHVGEVLESKRELAGEPKPANLVTMNTLRDWLIQADAGEVLRLSVIDVTAAGVDIIATLHDALMIEAPCAQIDDAVQRTRQAMERASAAVLFNPSRTTHYPLRVDAVVVRYPEHYRVTEEADWWGRLRNMLLDLTGHDLEAFSENAVLARE
jgi:DNA polymerase-1